MQFRFLAITLIAPLALTAPTPSPNIDNVVGRPTHTIQERQSSGSSSSSMISSIMSAALPIVEQMLSSMLPTIESMITSALKKRSDGSIAYEISIPHEISEALKD